MKNILYNGIILAAALVILSLSSCEKYLDKSPSAELPEDSVFTVPRLFNKYVDGIYPYLWYSPDANWTTYAFGGFCRLQMACLEDATDLSDGARSDAGPRTGLNIGAWLGYSGTQAEVVYPWEGAYKAIRICNQILGHVDALNGVPDSIRRIYRGQAYFFRGFFHFELVKRYGGVPYVNKVFTADENMDIPRNTYDDCITWLCADLDSAAANLPLRIPETEFGRPEKGAAMAIKARALIYAASPLNNNPDSIGYSVDKWVKAAQACADVMYNTGNRYSLVNGANYYSLFYGVPVTSETIFSRNGGAGGYGNSELSFPGWGSFSLGVGARPWSDEWGSTPCPTQNLMDLYETADGYRVVNNYPNYDGLTYIPQISPEAIASGYADSLMYQNRDPRMRLTYILNGTNWLNATPIELFFNENGLPGAHISKGTNWTRTGYLEKKFWDPNLYPTSGRTYLNYSFIRYTDVVMMFAEAMNEAYGPDVNGLGVTGEFKTAREAVDAIRLRVEHVPVRATNQAEMRERIMNERAIEFVYEDLRWFDVIRWRKGVEIFNKPVYGINTTKRTDGSFKLERIKIQDRTFQDYMHRYPIPQEEINKSYNLKQNTGW